MTMQELSRYHDIKIELEDLSHRIAELELTLIKATKYSDMKVDRSFSNTSPTEEIVIKLNNLKERYNNKQIKLVDELTRIEEYIDTINDNEVRTIMRKRFIDLLTWEQIADIMHYSNPVPYYKVRNYLKGGSYE